MVKILLVEDDKSFGYVLSEYMILKGYEVILKESVAEAIEVLSKFNFDLAVLDINLKQASGFEIARMIKSECPKLPFVFLTARDLNRSVKRLSVWCSRIHNQTHRRRSLNSKN